MKKNIIVISLIFLLANCGFTPIYLKNKDINFSIQQINYTGDRELNNFLKTNLSQYKNKKSENKIYIEVNSIYKKIILSKDKTGEVTNYQLQAEVIFLIKPLNKEIKITEKKLWIVRMINLKRLGMKEQSSKTLHPLYQINFHQN